MTIFPSLSARQIAIFLSSVSLASLLKLFLCSFDKLFFVRYAFNTKGFMFLNLYKPFLCMFWFLHQFCHFRVSKIWEFSFFGNTKSPSFFSPSTALHSVLLICCWKFSHSAFSTDWLQLGAGANLRPLHSEALSWSCSSIDDLFKIIFCASASTACILRVLRLFLKRWVSLALFLRFFSWFHVSHVLYFALPSSISKRTREHD